MVYTNCTVLNELWSSRNYAVLVENFNTSKNKCFSFWDEVPQTSYTGALLLDPAWDPCLVSSSTVLGARVGRTVGKCSPSIFVVDYLK